MPSCCVKGCRASTKLKMPGLSFHSFPSQKRRPEMFEMWLQNVQIANPNWYPGPCCHVCSLHFQPEMFDRTGQTVRLRESAIPVFFDVPLPVYCISDTVSRSNSSDVGVQTEASDSSDCLDVCKKWRQKQQKVKQRLKKRPHEAKQLHSDSQSDFISIDQNADHVMIIDEDFVTDTDTVTAVPSAGTHSMHTEHSYSVVLDADSSTVLDNNNISNVSASDKQGDVNGTASTTSLSEVQNASSDRCSNSFSNPRNDSVESTLDSNIPSSSNNNNIANTSVHGTASECNAADILSATVAQPNCSVTSSATGTERPVKVRKNTRNSVDHCYSRSLTTPLIRASRYDNHTDHQYLAMDRRTVLKAKLTNSYAQNMSQRKLVKALQGKVRSLETQVKQLTATLNTVQKYKPPPGMRILLPKDNNTRLFYDATSCYRVVQNPGHF